MMATFAGLSSHATYLILDLLSSSVVYIRLKSLMLQHFALVVLDSVFIRIHKGTNLLR